MIEVIFETTGHGAVTVTEAPEAGVHPNGHAWWKFKGDGPFKWAVACSYADLAEAVEACCGPIKGEGVTRWVVR
jgi:hypothetical protein